MSGESQYFNPIVEAMMGTVASQQRQQQIDQAKLQFKQQQDLEKMRLGQSQQALDTHEKQVEYEHQQAVDNLTKYQLPMLQANLELQKQGRLQFAQDYVKNGGSLSALANLPGNHYTAGNPGNLQPGFPQPPPVSLNNQPPPGGTLPQNAPSTIQPVQAQTPDTLSINGGPNLTAQNLYDPEQQAGQARLLAASKSGGEAAGQQPYIAANAQRNYQQQLALQQNSQRYGADQQQARLDAQERIARLDIGAQSALAAQNNRAKFELAMGGYNPEDPSSGSGYIPQTNLDLQTGKVDYNPKDPIQRAANAAMGNTPDIDGLMPRPLGKKNAAELQTLNTLPGIFDQMRKLADRFPDEEKEGSNKAVIHGLWQEHVANSQFSTDLKNDTQNIQTQLVPIARALEGATGGRILSKQLETEVGGLVAPGQTKQQAYKKIQNLQDTLVNQEQNRILTGLPISQQHLIQKTYGLNQIPATAGSQSSTSKSIHIDNKGQKWQYNGNGNPYADTNQANWSKVPN